jgi:hypothetical protein
MSRLAEVHRLVDQLADGPGLVVAEIAVCPSFRLSVFRRFAFSRFRLGQLANRETPKVRKRERKKRVFAALRTPASARSLAALNIRK